LAVASRSGYVAGIVDLATRGKKRDLPPDCLDDPRCVPTEYMRLCPGWFTWCPDLCIDRINRDGLDANKEIASGGFRFRNVEIDKTIVVSDRQIFIEPYSFHRRASQEETKRAGGVAHPFPPSFHTLQLLVRLRRITEIGLHSFESLGEERLGFVIGHRWGDDAIFPFFPVRRCRHFEL
jgi:hypothetical protein